MRRLFLIFSTMLFAVACVDDPTQPTSEDLNLHRARAAKQKVHFTLTLLHNNDGESELLNLGGENTDFGGVDRFVTRVQKLRLEALRPRGHRLHHDDSDGWNRGRRGVVLISSGDNFLAGPEWNASIKKGIPYYDAIALRVARYDALAIGNHEFDFGPEILASFIESFGPYTQIGGRFEDRLPPFLSANLDFSGEPVLQDLVDLDRIAARTVVKKRGRRIGIVGATTPALPTISSPRNVVASTDVAGAVQAEVDKLESMGVNIIILTSHLQDVDEDLALIAQLRGVDVAIAGGGDELLANSGDLLVPGDVAVGPYPIEAFDVDGTMVPVVTTAGSYSYVGRLVAGFNKYGELVEIDEISGPVRVAGGSEPDAVEPNPIVKRLVTDKVQEAVDGLAANIIATSEVDLDGRRSEVRSRETNEGNLIADALRWQATQVASSFGLPAPDVGIQNGGGIRNDNIIPAGGVSELDTWDMVPFSNFVSIVPDFPRAQFKEILENAVSRIESDLTGGTGRFAQLSGITIVYDVSEPAMEIDLDGNVVRVGTRIRSAVLDDGTVLVEDGSLVDGDPITIATIDFLVSRDGDQYPFRGADFTRVGFTYQQAVFNYLVDGLGGMVTSAEYPVGGESRITKIGSAALVTVAN